MTTRIGSHGALDVTAIRTDFPILEKTARGKPLIYLDNAATSQKPRQVIQALVDYYEGYNANIHRGVHALAEEATERYEGTRQKVARFIGAASTKEIVFTRNTTEAINLVAYTWGRQHIGAGDEILITRMEHHSNIVPWQLIAAERGAKLRYIEFSEDGIVEPEDIKRALTDRTRILAITHMSNVLGTINPVAEAAKLAHAAGALILVDGAQSVPHMPVDVQELDCDFLAFSSHKMLGPTGVGVLYGKQALLESMPPFLGGGEMIERVSDDMSTWNELPWKYEAGTPNIADVVAFGAAIDYLSALGMDRVREHERELVAYAIEAIGGVPGIKIYGPRDAVRRGGVVAFNFGEIHAHDVGTILDYEGIAVRVGHHCCQLLMKSLDIPGTARASFYVYNTPEEVDALVTGLSKVKEMFKLGA
jgi:cysteine desulfurase / selenocysteine lyase